MELTLWTCGDGGGRCYGLYATREAALEASGGVSAVSVHVHVTDELVMGMLQTLEAALRTVPSLYAEWEARR